MQIVSDLDGRLVAISDPVPGSRHDTKEWEQSGLDEILDLSNTLADRGYEGTHAITPIKKHPGQKTSTRKQRNTTDS